MPTDRLWILTARKLSGESSEEEVREMEELLRTYPNLHFSVEIITNFWNQHVKTNGKQMEESYATHIQRMKNMGIFLQHEENKDEGEGPYLLEGSRKNITNRRWAVAATVIVLLTAGFFFFKAQKTTTRPDDDNGLAVTTKYGSRTNIQLPDGSKVWLNSGSTLKYDKQFEKDIREVVLSGEAFFEVVRNPDKPFIIHTTIMDIKVLGTKFNVKSYANDKQSEATLIHGSIEISLKKRGFEKILLKPNEKIVVMNDRVKDDSSAVTPRKNITEPIMALQKINYEPTDSTIIETSWVDNKLIFRDESFEDLSVRMERWYGIPVWFQEPALKNIRFTGIFTNETIQQALDALQITAEFHYIFQENRIIITK